MTLFKTLKKREREILDVKVLQKDKTRLSHVHSLLPGGTFAAGFVEQVSLLESLINVPPRVAGRFPSGSVCDSTQAQNIIIWLYYYYFSLIFQLHVF